MRVLHFTEVYASRGGVENYVISLVSLLTGAGHVNHVICREPLLDSTDAPGGDVSVVPRNSDLSAERRRIVVAARGFQPDVVILHAVHDPEVVADLAAIGPTVGYVHTFYPVCPGLIKLFRVGETICTRSFGFGCVPMIYLRRCASARHPLSVARIMQRTALYQRAYRSLPSVLVGSNYMKSLLSQNGYHHDRLIVLPPHFVPSWRPWPDASTNKANMILFAGRLEIEKGVPYLLQACSFLKIPYQLKIAGDGSYMGRYRKLASRLGIGDKVEFAGWMSGEQLEMFFVQCAVVVVPSICPEPFGKAGLEAMTYGKPVVAFNVGGISEWLQDGHSGFLVPPGNTGAMAQRLEELLSDSELRRYLGQNARHWVFNHDSEKQHLDILLPVLEKVRSNRTSNK